MVDKDIIETVQRYLAALPKVGINPSMAVIFGSFARGQAHEWSDIDVLVIAPEFDSPRPIPIATASKLWAVAREVDTRIEALPCGLQEWQQPHFRPVLDIAAREGFEVAA